MTDGEKLALTTAALTFAALFYFTYHTVKGVVPAATHTVRDSAFAGLDALTMVVGEQGSQGEGYEWRRHDFDPTNERCVYLPVRYPHVSGQNLSAVMHHGWSSMMKAAPAKAAAWFDNPPQDVMW